MSVSAIRKTKTGLGHKVDGRLVTQARISLAGACVAEPPRARFFRAGRFSRRFLSQPMKVVAVSFVANLL